MTIGLQTDQQTEPATAGSVQRLVSQRQQFPSALHKQTVTTTTNNHIACCQPAGDCLVKSQPEIEVERTYSRPATNKAGGGKALKGFGYDRPDRTPERIAKAQAFHALVLERRKDKSRCPRCGHPRGEKYRTCDRCREKIRKAKLRAKGIAVVKGGEYSNAGLAAMVLQMRREMDRMQARFKLWQKAADYRRNLHYRTNTMRKKYLKTVSHAEAMDYLAETNHAYENDETQAG